MAEPRYVGGQAVVEGVMMRGESTWAVAVRRPDGEIAVDVHEVPGWSEKYRNIPIFAALPVWASPSGSATGRSRGRRTCRFPRKTKCRAAS